MNVLLRYVQLTKPTIVFLVAITGVCTMAAEGALFLEPLKMIHVLLAIVLSAGSANAFNQLIDRDIDSVMERTRSRRPLPLGKLGPIQVFVFALLLGVGSNLYLWLKIHPMAAIISIATILFYIFIYTLWLKRRHYYNIVIGGAAGATAPLIASAAVTGEPSVLSWILFLLIFFWTPPHFWALALAIQKDYEKVKIPMLPNVLGVERTRKEILIYTLCLLPIQMAPFFLELAGVFYLLSSSLLWIWYALETKKGLQKKTESAYKRLFFVSIAYLFFLFLAIALDGGLRFYGSVDP